MYRELQLLMSGCLSNNNLNAAIEPGHNGLIDLLTGILIFTHSIDVMQKKNEITFNPCWQVNTS